MPRYFDEPNDDLPYDTADPADFIEAQRPQGDCVVCEEPTAPFNECSKCGGMICPCCMCVDPNDSTKPLCTHCGGVLVPDDDTPPP